MPSSQEALGLPRYPHRIESFDISNIQGSENVAAMVVCEDGLMKKSEYRKFTIRRAVGADDFASMNEAVGRRYSRLVREKKRLPDLVFIDGGKGQLSAASAALHELGLSDLPLVGIVKPRGRHSEISHLLVKGREDEPIVLEKTSPVLRLVQMIRDETHRFAVTYHRHKRAMRDFNSELTAIPGIGEKMKDRLLRNFGSLRRVSEATVAELRPFVGRNRLNVLSSTFKHILKTAEFAQGGRVIRRVNEMNRLMLVLLSTLASAVGVYGQVRVMPGDVKDTRRTDGFFSKLEVEMKVLGDVLAGARGIRVNITKALDETGKNLLPEKKGDDEFKEISSSGNETAKVDLELKNPARRAMAVQEISGTSSSSSRALIRARRY